MARVKGALNARKKHKKILKLAKGFVGARSKQYRIQGAGRQGPRTRRLLFHHLRPLQNVGLCFEGCGKGVWR